jgi:signal peptidase I
VRRKIGTALLVLLVLLVVAGTVARLFLVALVKPEHMAMAPNILNGDQVVLLRRATPALGDVVLYERPDAKGREALGRVVAVGPVAVELAPGGMPSLVGDARIERRPLDPGSGALVAPGDATLGGRESLLETLPGGRAYAVLTPERGGKGKAYAPRTEDVPAGAFLVLNDNRAAPEGDSRTVGPIPAAAIIGVARWFLSAGPYSTDAHHPALFDPVP